MDGPFVVEALDSDKYEWMVEVLQAAKAWGVPPLTMLVGRPNRWRSEDTTFARALEIYEQTRVNQYGYPIRRAEDRALSRHFQVDDRTVDYSVKAMDEWEKRRADSDRKLPSGVRPRVVFKPPR